MDTLTHIVLGACTGEAMANRRLGKRALLIGAFANALPDIDVASAFWLDTDESLLAHRGFTHSFMFVALVATALAFSFKRWYRIENTSFKFWFWFEVDSSWSGFYSTPFVVRSRVCPCLSFYWVEFLTLTDSDCCINLYFEQGFRITIACRCFVQDYIQ